MTSVRGVFQPGWVVVLALACSGEVAPAGVPDAGARYDAGAASDAGTPDGGDVVDERLVEVTHERELRGVWIATVANINFPSRAGLGPDALRAELDALVTTVAETNLNAIFFQVRPESDAVYSSTLEPWSRFLTGTQGGDPGLDPLEVLLERAHARGIEVHAWLNPYRAKTNRSVAAVPPHISIVAAEHAHPYGDLLWMDPAARVVRERTVAVVEDLVARYAIDGLHFDDYFYPYPDGTPFPDDATYADYVAGGGTLARDDWRRDNVHRLVSEVWDAVQRIRPDCRFGISPFGIYRPGMPEGIVGLDQYAEIFADPLRWLDEGWVDYLAPQLYWPTTQTRQAYAPLLDWWTGVAPEGRAIFAGNYLSQLSSSPAWTAAEIVDQIEISRGMRARGSLGNVFFHVGPLAENRDGIATILREELYPRVALTPPMAEAPPGAPAPPDVVEAGGVLSVSHPAIDDVRWWVLYRETDDTFVVDRIVPAAAPTIDAGAGTVAVTAVDGFGRESLGRRP